MVEGKLVLVGCEWKEILVEMSLVTWTKPTVAIEVRQWGTHVKGLDCTQAQQVQLDNLYALENDVEQNRLALFKIEKEQRDKRIVPCVV
jgi:hypothetical protein